MVITHKIQLYPTKKQEILLNKSCGVARFAYNWALETWNTFYLKGEKINRYSLSKLFNSIKKDSFPFVLEVSKCCAQGAIYNLNSAFVNFFNKKAKHPSFHKKGYKESFTMFNDQFRIIKNNVLLYKIGLVCMAEPLRFSGKIMSGTVSKKADKWFFSVSVDTDIKPYEKTGKSVGIDLGVKDLITTSDNEKFVNPRWINKAEKKLKKYNRILARRMKGSKRREKVKLRLARQHLKVSNQRKDYIHKITSYLVKKYDNICIEDLNVRGMVKNHNLAKAVSNVSFGEIARQLKYKCNLYGKTLLQVDRFFPSSKTCSVCGCVQDKMPLHIREWTCSDCGAKHDRDLNAAVNILRQAMSEVTHVERKALAMFSDITQLDSLNRESNKYIDNTNLKSSLKHVIQCMPDGSIEMTLKDGELKPFNGHRTIKRMSEILFDEASQHFYIVFKQDGTKTPAMFSTYEEAINYEVSTINKKRLLGVTFNESL